MTTNTNLKSELCNLLATLHIRNEIVDDFDSNNKFIILWKKQNIPFPIYVRRGFSIVVADVALERVNGKYHKGVRTDNKSAYDYMIDDPEVLNKEQAEDYVASLLDNGYEIVFNSCIEQNVAKHYALLGLLRIVKYP